MSSIDWISVRGFKSIRSVKRLSLGRVNVLIGPNGSGKSNFIEVFLLLRALSQGQLQRYVGRAGGAEKILHFGSKTTNGMDIEIGFDGGKYDYLVYLSLTDDDSLYPDAESSLGGRQPRIPSE